MKQDPRPLPRQLPRTNQYPHERTTRADRRRARQAYCPGYYRTPHEHYHWLMGHERLGARTGIRGGFDVVLVFDCGTTRVWIQLLLYREEGLWYCLNNEKGRI